MSSSNRAGAHPGTHEIGFDSQADTITLRHTARSREGFARGALKAAQWINGQEAACTNSAKRSFRVAIVEEVVTCSQDAAPRWSRHSRRTARSTKQRCAAWCAVRSRPASTSSCPAAPRAKARLSRAKNTCASSRSRSKRPRAKSRCWAAPAATTPHEVIELAQEVEALGADGILSVTPYYNKPTQEGLYQHYQAIASAIRLPIVVYSVQGRTGVNVEPATLARLAEFENIVGVKEASGIVGQMAHP